MPDFARYRVYKIVEMKDGAIFKTKHVGSYWFEFKERTPEEETSLAKAWGGDELGSPDSGDYVFGISHRSPKFAAQIVTNLRHSQSNLKLFTDDQIYDAYEDYAVSSDYGDESLVIEYIRELRPKT